MGHFGDVLPSQSLGSVQKKTTLNKTNNKNQSDLNYQRNTPVVDSWGQTDRWTDTVPLHRPFHKLCKQCQQLASVKKHNAAINGRYSQTLRHTRLELPGSAGTRKVKPIWILLQQETVSGNGISWATCKSAPRSRQITTPEPHQCFL